jgi:hypothetical protein
MTLCEFCVLQLKNGKCARENTIPKKMRCADFTPGIERFCATPADYAGREQLKQMALYFGFAGKELKRVLTMSEVWTDDRAAGSPPAANEQQSERRFP